MSKVISVENLTKEYQLGTFSKASFRNDMLRFFGKKVSNVEFVKALDNVSFNVFEGDVLGVVGGNGAGKSTLLKILSRVTGPSSGRIEIKGNVSSLLEVGTGFHPELTGLENIYLNGTILGMRKKEIDSKVEEIVEFSGIKKFISTPVKRYSSGMIVRLGFSVAAFLEPDILIIDEVLSVGDADFQAKCINRVRDISNGGRAVLFVSHNMKSVQNLCNRAILIKDGKVRLDSATNEVIDTYLRSDFVNYSNGVIPESHERRFATREVLLTKFGLIDDEFRIVNSLRFREPMRFQVELKKFVEVESVFLAIVISNTNMEKVIHCDKDITNYVKNNDLNSFVFNLDEKLVPGTYSVTCSLFNPQGACYDDVEKCFTFEVLDVPFGTKSVYLGPREQGYVYTELRI